VSATQLHVKEKISFINFIFLELPGEYFISLVGHKLITNRQNNPKSPATINHKLEDGTKGWRKGT
jgi:hypothetical protein